MNEAPNESIYGIMLAMAEIGLQIYIFAAKNRRSGIAMDEKRAEETLSPENLEKGVREDGKVYFEGEAADAVSKELLEKGLITDERYKEIISENEHLFEDAEAEEYLPFSDYEIGGGEFEIGGNEQELEP
jgi:hypothetical protein